jgi:PEP-CTERM motif
MKASIHLKPIWIPVALACLLSLQAHAESINNGGFESGFLGWTRANQTGSEGGFSLQSGALSPVNGDTVPAPPAGSAAAMSDAQGPGSHVLYQSFVVSAPVSLTFLSFDLFIGNRATAFYTPNTLDFATPTLNQQARVDILAGGADPFSVSASDVLLNVFRTSTGNALVSGYNRYSVDITSLLNSHLNTPLMLRFAEADNVSTFQMGVDNVSIGAIPEPSTFMLLGVGALLGVGWGFRRRAC